MCPGFSRESCLPTTVLDAGEGMSRRCLGIEWIGADVEAGAKENIPGKPCPDLFS